MAYYDEKERSRTLQAFNTYRSIMRRAYVQESAFSKGRFWYQMNGSRIERACKASNVKPHVGCAIAALLSPLTPWERTFEGTMRLLREYPNDRDTLREIAVESTVLNGNAYDAVDVLLGISDPEDVVNGPKVDPFYRNLLGDLEAITVDTWMYSLVGKFGLSSSTPTDNARRAIKRALMMLGTMWDLAPAQCQAVVWVQSRDYSDE